MKEVAKFTFAAKSDFVAETTIEVHAPWNGDLAAAQKAAEQLLKDFGAALG